MRIGSGYVVIKGDYKQLEKDLNASKRTFSGAIDDMQRKARSFTWNTMKVGAVAMSAAVTAGLYKSIDAASDFTETLSKSNTVFKDSASRIVEWSQTSVDAFGMSQQAALETAATMGNMYIQLGAGTGVAAENSMAMVQLAADLASFHNVAGGSVEVLAAMQSAFRGEYDALQRYIPTINAAAVQQKALAQTGKTSAKELTALEKATAAQAIIMRDAGDATGDFARTSDDLANKKRILAGRISDLSVQIGNSLIPHAEDAVGIIDDWIKANDDLIAQHVENYILSIADSLGTIKSVYDKLPDGVVGAAGYGLVGTLLFGGKAGGVIGATTLIFTQVKKLENWLTTVNEKIWQALWPTGGGRTRHKIPWEKPALNASVADSGGGAGSGGGGGAAASDDISGVLAGFDTQEDREMVAAAERDLFEQRLETLREFNTEYEQINMSRFEMERQALNEQVAAYRRAGAKKEELTKYHEARMSDITMRETQDRMGFYSDMAGRVSDTFQQIAQAGGKHSKEAFYLYQASKLAEIGISTASAYMKAIAEPALPWPGNVAWANVILGLGATQAALVAAAQPPSYDEGGISRARGVYQTGDIDEAHIPLKSGKVPVALSGGGGGPNNVVIIRMNNPVFQDLATQRRVMSDIATQVAKQVAPAAVYQDYQNDGVMRRMVRAGG